MRVNMTVIIMSIYLVSINMACRAQRERAMFKKKEKPLNLNLGPKQNL